MRLSDEDLAILAQQDMHTLARWYCDLNVWKWPEELPDPEPAYYIADGRRSEIRHWIYEAIGGRECSREWNRDMTDEEFNTFWRGMYEGVPHERERYYKQLAARVAANGLEGRHG